MHQKHHDHPLPGGIEDHRRRGGRVEPQISLEKRKIGNTRGKSWCRKRTCEECGAVEVCGGEGEGRRLGLGRTYLLDAGDDGDGWM